MNSDQQIELDRVLAEVEGLKARVALLESQVNQSKSTQSTLLQETVVKASLENNKANRIPADAQTSRAEPRLSENFIGGKLLNRIGALIVIFAAAYFLKWSFDNHIIGELGRCVLGLVAGISLMIAGQIFLRKSYTVFAQGLTGAGIAIIYLSSYAAVNYYHLISPYVAFALMFITALTSGVLSAMENMPGSAVMATMGGFLVPFLMGSHSGQIVPLLSYVLILDLGILFLAYYRKWFFLDVIALAGSGIISTVAFNMDWKVWPGQAFLLAFLLLFIGMAVIYNSRSRNSKLALLIINTLFFVGFSFINLFDKMIDWLGLISVIFAVIYLVAYFVSEKVNATNFFKTAIIVVALIFALLTAPFQLNGVYCQIAWLAVAAVLLYISDLMKSKVVLSISLPIIAATFISVFVVNHVTYPVPVFNKTTLIMTLCAVDWLWALYINHKNYPDRKGLNLILALFIVGTVFYLLDFDINNAIYHYQANQSFAFLIPISWALVSSMVLFLGVRRDNKSIRIYSLVLFGIVILRTLFYDLQQLDIVFKILVLLAIGLISLAISFFYQKRMKGEAL